MSFQTEYEFTLPSGYVDRDGNLHQNGVMRLATAADEIFPMRDSRVRQNPAYQSIIVLSRVIVRLGTITQVSPEIVESLFSRDLVFLNEMYEQINAVGDQSIEAICPVCGCRHSVPLSFTRET